MMIRHAMWLTLIPFVAFGGEVEDHVARLRHADPVERELAAIDLSDLGPAAAPAVPALRAALADESGAVRQAAVIALREIGVAARPAARALFDYTLVADDETGEREDGWAALAALDQPEQLAAWLVEARRELRLPHTDLGSLVWVLGERCLPFLVEAVRSDDRGWRLAGAEAVGEIPQRGEIVCGGTFTYDDDVELEFDPELGEAERRALDEALPAPDMQPAGGGFAFEEAGEGGGILSFGEEPIELAWELPESLVRGLVAMLARDEDESEAALEALLNMGPQAACALDALIAALEGEDPYRALEVLDALALEDPTRIAGAKPALLRLLREGEDTERATDLVLLLEHFPGEDVTAVLIGLLDHEDSQRRGAAVAALHGRAQPAGAIARALVALLEREGLPPRRAGGQGGVLNFGGDCEPREAAVEELRWLAEQDPQAVGEAAQAVTNPDLHALLGRILAEAGR